MEPMPQQAWNDPYHPTMARFKEIFCEIQLSLYSFSRMMVHPAQKFLIFYKFVAMTR
jgi:hypothetical protein